MGGPKGDYKGFLNHVGVKWDDQAVAFDTHNPNPRFDHLPPHILFVGERPDGTNPFADGPDIVGGFSQVVVLFGGVLEPNSGYEDKFTPLLVTGRTSSGINKFDDLVDRHPFFGLQMRPVRTPGPATPSTHVMAARVTGSNGEEGVKDRNLIVVADLDLFGDTFFQMHEQGGDLDADGLLDVRFDNVPFLLNAVDTLAGDERFIQLRKRQPEFRRLTMVDELTEEAREKRQKSMEEANSRADQELEEAQKALDGAVAAVRERTDLDETTKRIMVESARQAEERRLQVKTEKIEREKQKAITRTETEHRRAVDEIQNRIRLFALLLPPVPALLLGAVIFGRKRRRERESIPNARRTVANRKNSKGDVA
jgi:ABC-2 type transport system permease protein